MGWLATLIMWLTFITVLAAAAGLAFVYCNLVSYYNMKQTAENKSVFKQWVAAKKAKICPIIEFTKD